MAQKMAQKLLKKLLENGTKMTQKWLKNGQ